MRRPAPTSGVFLPGLDALRGAAVLAVFVQHLGDRFRPLWERWLGEGWALSLLRHAHAGVDLFFVVSGFSLAGAWIAAAERGSPPPVAGRFFFRRALRLLPAFYVALLVHVAARPAVVAEPAFGASLAAHLALLQGLVAPGGIVLVGAAWSLTTEAGFYLAMPLLARHLFARPRTLRPFAVAAAVCAGVWLVRAALHEAVLDPGRVTSLLEATQRRWFVSRIDQFTLGALAAVIHARLGGRVPRAGWLLAGSLVVLAIGLRLDGAFYVERGGSWPYPIVSLAMAGLVLGVAGAGASWAAPRPLRAIGVVSYGVFLYHQLALASVGPLVPGPDGARELALVATLALAASLVAGFLSWRLVELPAMALASTGGARQGPGFGEGPGFGAPRSPLVHGAREGPIPAPPP